MSLEDDAREFAAIAHARQVRKYTGEPYIIHPYRVVQILKTVTQSPEAIAAAWLHDVVEDCGVLLSDVYKKFGGQVAGLVWELSDVSKPADGNRAARKAIDRRHMACASSMGKTIKLADLIDNSETITKYDPDFSRVYMPEKRLLLVEALIGGDKRLWSQADEIVRKWELENA